MPVRTTMPAWRTLSWLAGVAVLGGDAAQGQPSAVVSSANPVDSSKIQAVLTALVRHNHGPVGAIVTIDNGDAVTTHRAGELVSGDKIAPRPRDHFRVASLSDALTGAVALSLVDDGSLNLRDTVGRWLPGMPLAWHSVTLFQLLNQTSGVPDFVRSTAFLDAIGKDPTRAKAPSEIVAMAGNAAQFPAGARYEYSHSNAFLTALIIEAATGQSFGDVLEERLVEPLGLDDTYLPARDDPTVAEPSLHGYDPGDDGLGKEDVTEAISFGGWAWAAGGIVSSSADLTHFIKEYVGAQLFSAGLSAIQRQAMQLGDSQPPGPGGNLAGVALFRYDTRCGTVFGYAGAMLGYTHFMAASADGTRAVVFTISTQVDPELLPELRTAQETAVCEALGSP